MSKKYTVYNLLGKEVDSVQANDVRDLGVQFGVHGASECPVVTYVNGTPVPVKRGGRFLHWLSGDDGVTTHTFTRGG